MKVLVFGYGNPGRLDDGLGPYVAEHLGMADRFGDVAFDANYQLSVEDAAAVSSYDVVVFVDAATNGPEPFSFEPLRPEHDGVGFSSHSVSPGAVLGLAERLFGATTKGYLLGIRGYEWNEFGERLSEGARVNAAAALDFLEKWLTSQGQEIDPGSKRTVKEVIA
jgi:hydrogenase maturation protease